MPNVSLSLSRADYDRIEAVNFSRLKVIGRSPRHYRHRLDEPRKDTPALGLGRAVHTAILEPHLFDAQVVRWDCGRRYGKEWDAFREQHEGADILTAEDHALCLAMKSAVYADPTAKQYVTGGHAEVTVQWRHEDAALADDDEPPTLLSFACKARLDYVTEHAIVDLKTCRDASQDGFGREAWRLQYHVQAAWYRDAYAAATGVVLPFYIVAVEKDAPHVVQTYRIPDVLLDLGRESYRAMLRVLDRCQRDDQWPGYSEGELELMPPAWAMRDTDADDDIGLDFGEAA